MIEIIVYCVLGIWLVVFMIRQFNLTRKQK